MGTVFFDWTMGLIFAVAGAAAGVVVGFALQFIGAVLFIWSGILKESFIALNYLPLAVDPGRKCRVHSVA